MKPKRCAECGAELELRSAACPLCGSDPEAKPDWGKADAERADPPDVDRYHSDLRRLRAELKRLREEAEAS